MNLKNRNAIASLPIFDKMVRIATKDNSSIQLRYWLPKITRNLLELAKDYDAAVQTHALKDEEGNVIPATEQRKNEAGELEEVQIQGSFTIPQESIPQVEELLNMEVECVGRKFALDEFKDLDLTVLELETIEWFIEDVE